MFKFTPGQPVSTKAATHSAFATTPQIFPDFQSRMRVSGRWILGADMAALVAAFGVGAVLVTGWHTVIARDATGGFFDIVTTQEAAVFFTLALAAILWLDSRGHYRQRLPYWETVGHIAGISCIGFLAGGFVEFAARDNSSRLWVAFSWILFGLFALAGRGIARAHLKKTRVWNVPAVVIGSGHTADEAKRALSRDTSMGFTIVDTLPPAVLAGMKKPLAWKQVLMMHDAHYIFLALEGGDIERYSVALKSLPRARVPFSIIPPWLGLPSSTLTPHHFMMQDVLMLHDTNRLKLPLPRLLKRAVDIALASLATAALSPFMIAVAIAVRRDGGPAFFKQARVGRNGMLFQCYKFRSMRIDADEALDLYLKQNPDAVEEWTKYQKLKNDVRVTRVGAFIRKTSLDELPQLINVIKGDMSLVGPRPCMPGQENLYAEDFSFYESVRPGITGPWQVSGRSQLSFKERVALEAWYARNWNLWLDIVIILKTFPTLLKRGQAF
ncbi:MAG: exopolysaccharide biosynthesis polyprenyl glycosylphosphotransferase [Alphaproteobacteria bacterium]|nr:exopolysaccharide biosynthesis polyprenyl glycosylphosphotransferase [Alphaproteobacteria bacterium]